MGVRTATTPPAPARPPCTLGEVVKLVGTGRVGKGFDSFLRPWRITEFFRKQLLCACAHISQPDWQIPRQIRATGNPLWKFLEFQCTWNFPWISVFYPWNANPLATTPGLSFWHIFCDIASPPQVALLAAATACVLACCRIQVRARRYKCPAQWGRGCSSPAWTERGCTFKRN